jgi:hypothetical protein
VLGTTGAGATFWEGFFSSTVAAVDLGLGLVAFLLDLCNKFMTREAIPPETTMRSQRGKRFVILYTITTTFAKWSRMYSLALKDEIK